MRADQQHTVMDAIHISREEIAWPALLRKSLPLFCFHALATSFCTPHVLSMEKHDNQPVVMDGSFMRWQVGRGRSEMGCRLTVDRMGLRSAEGLVVVYCPQPSLVSVTGRT